ncbi:hypothetical protein ACGFNY_45370 [Streptomyces chartreusis]|uniref:hypothetical protein n=1 Tax=Streptomyces chartreusis TaxID=1969 RepID=UPI00372310B5
MYLTYKPEGSEEPTRWKYDPRKLMSAEREKLERLTDRNYSEFTKDVVSGNSLCRRALLFVYLKRQHPTTRFEDVDFAWDELSLEYTKAELITIRETVAESASGEKAAVALAKLDEQIAEAPEDPDDEGKAQLPIAG